jgi:putative beta-lysine N-acetyltransferase
MTAQAEAHLDPTTPAPPIPEAPQGPEGDPQGSDATTADHIAPERLKDDPAPAVADRPMGLVQLTLDRGVRTTVIGQLYGMDFEIDGDGYAVRLFFDNYNRRLKVLDYTADNYALMVQRVDELADANGFDKVFFKAHHEDWQRFLEFGYQLEGILRYFYHGQDAYVMSKFRSVERAHNVLVIDENELIETLMREPRDAPAKPMPPGYALIECGEQHIEGLVALYKNVFETYPSPLTSEDYVRQTMRRNVIYRAVLDADGHLVSAASAEIDHKHSNAEVTDCATHVSQRGKGLMRHLLGRIVEDLDGLQIRTPYTLARAASFGMNLVFYRLGFEYCGRLVNNCDIYGQYEDMNIWVRRPLS